MNHQVIRATIFMLIALLIVASSHPAPADASRASDPVETVTQVDTATAPEASHRLIVRLSAPALAEYAAADSHHAVGLYTHEGLLDIESPMATALLQRIAAEQRAFEDNLAKAIPAARVATYIDEHGARRDLRTSVVLNAIVIEAGLDADVDDLAARVAVLPGVTGVGRDLRQNPDMYDSLKVINAAAAWNNPEVGGSGRAGEGIRFASMDGGVHKDAAMFSGEDYKMPRGYPLGYVENTNGKIIVSRAYFRSWDPPAPDDDTSWPGALGTPHGVHTAGTAAGNMIEVHYPGAEEMEDPETIAGVAPRAYVMSYRVFYSSVNGIGSFYNAEGVRALEDVVVDGAQVLNNSWGGGPGSLGGEFDPLDQALINAWNAGVFVAMSNGNAGPNTGTGDHPNPSYINVAASTKGSYYTSVGFNVTAPEPVTDSLKGMPYGTAGFGPPIPVGETVGPFGYIPAERVDGDNVEGCEPFPDDSFTARAALIMRGTCNFTQKVLNAQNAGASFVVIYNHAAGGDATMGMGGSDDNVTIPSVFIGHGNGLRLVSWYGEHGEAAQFALDNRFYKVSHADGDEGATPPDRIANFSSRGPGVGNTFKPEIAAPGVSIMSQGYAPATGEDRHLGFGQVGGTSMAAPHVAGAATMLRQIHPEWPNSWIKSALMSTSRYLEIYTAANNPAQPLDMGAGRLDLTNAADPGVILSPPSLGFGLVVSGTTQALTLGLTSVADSEQTWSLAAIDTRGGFDNIQPLAGVSLSTQSVTLTPGDTDSVEVTWDTAAAGWGDQQGFLVLTSADYEAHLPLWIRVAHPPAEAEVLIMDNDGSNADDSLIDYLGFYTRTLEAMEVAYDVWDVDAQAAADRVPPASWLNQYSWVIYQTGDNRSVSTPGGLGQNRLMEYANDGGKVVVFGQNAAQVLGSNNPAGGTYFFGATLAATWQADSVSAGAVFTDTAQVLTGIAESPFDGLVFDVSARGDGAGNQTSIDSLSFADDGVFVNPMNLLQYAHGGGIVAGGRRIQPSVDRPGRTFLGEGLLFGFGLEGVNDDTGYDSRQALLGAVRSWFTDAIQIQVQTSVQPAHRVTYVQALASSTSGASPTLYRVDFGDGSGIFESSEIATNGTVIVGHVYKEPGTYTVTVEARNEQWSRDVAQVEVTIEAGPDYATPDLSMDIYLPYAAQNHVLFNNDPGAMP